MDDVDLLVPAPVEPMLAVARRKVGVPLRCDRYEMPES
jgi:hypothetical protein